MEGTEHRRVERRKPRPGALVVSEHPTVMSTWTVFRSTADGWTFGLNVEFEGHRFEAQLSVTFLLWKVVWWWRRDQGPK